MGLFRKFCLVGVCLCLTFGSTTAQADSEPLAKCQTAGETGAAGVALAACAVLKSKCPPPPAVSEELAGRSSLELDTESLTSDFLYQLDRKNCGTLFTTACKAKAAELALEDPGCGELLTRGPGKFGNDCTDFTGVRDIFTAELEVCNTDDLDIPKTDTPQPGVDSQSCEEAGTAEGNGLGPSVCTSFMKKCSPEADLSSTTSSDHDAGTVTGVVELSCSKLFTVACQAALSDKILSESECADIVFAGPQDGGNAECYDSPTATAILEKELKVCEDKAVDYVQGTLEPSPAGMSPPPVAASPSTAVDSPPSTPSQSDPCKCIEGNEVNGVVLPVTGCDKICYLEDGKDCGKAKFSRIFGTYWRFC